jgi:hypothetical protein
MIGPRRTSSALGAVAATAAGTVGAAWAYDAGSSPGPPVPVASSTPAQAQAVAKRPLLVWAPCRPPAVLRGEACVTDRVRTVVLPAPPVPALPPAASQPVAVTRSDDGGRQPGTDDRDDDGREEQSEDEVEHESEHESEPPEPQEPEDP